MSLSKLFEPLRVGALVLPNRFVMAPMTRCRADLPGNIPNALMGEMYAQRASAGLVITEATMVQAGHSAFYGEPGCFDDAQVAGWKRTTEAVHRKGGRIALQLYHGGRASHSVNGGEKPVSSSAVAIEGHKLPGAVNPTGTNIPYEMPRALREDEVGGIVAIFANAARCGLAAGFDAVEVHGANGYLVDQFWRDGMNQREDRYGGSIENRARLLLEVVKAVSDVFGGADRVGVRLSPINSYNGGSDSDAEALTRYTCAELWKLRVAYVHMIRADFFKAQQGEPLKWARESFGGVIIGNLGYDAKEAEAAIRDGAVDAVSFATKFLANPDFVERTRDGKGLNEPRQEFYFSHGAEGYVDYPTATEA